MSVYLYCIDFERLTMLKKYIIILVMGIVFIPSVQASENSSKQEITQQHNKNAKKTSVCDVTQLLRPIPQVHGPIIKTYEDGTRETDFNDGTGVIMVEHCQGFYYCLYPEDIKSTRK